MDVPGGWRLWGEQYNLNLPDAFEVPAEISKDICGKLGPRLTETDGDHPTLCCNTSADLDSYADSDGFSSQEMEG